MWNGLSHIIIFVKCHLLDGLIWFRLCSSLFFILKMSILDILLYHMFVHDCRGR